jgi:hypothetical protein
MSYGTAKLVREALVRQHDWRDPDSRALAITIENLDQQLQKRA